MTAWPRSSPCDGALFGHIHEAYGQWQLGRATLANVSVLDDDYALVNPVRVFDV